MTGSQAKEELQDIINRQTGDAESDHILSDDILCQLLCDLGFQDVVDIYKQIPKWYS